MKQDPYLLLGFRRIAAGVLFGLGDALSCLPFGRRACYVVLMTALRLRYPL